MATADADMKRLGFDKPWFSAKAEAKAKEMPPPDVALLGEFAGTYKLQTINGKPLPHDYGNGCKMTSVWVEAAADGTYKSGFTMACANGPFESKDTGVYGVTATTAVFSKDPDTAPATRQPDGFTRSYGGDTYVFKRTSKPAAAPAPAASAASSASPPVAPDAPKN